MNNLHRELAPISDSAWAQIEDEATRTLKRHLAARRVVDVEGPSGFDLNAVGTGHVRRLETDPDSASARVRVVRPIVELLVPFELDRQEIDDVERGAMDSNWQPVKEATKQIAFAEDRAIFDGYGAAGIQGMVQGTSHPIRPLPSDAAGYPRAVAEAISQLRLSGVGGPYRAVLSANAYTLVSETSDHGYPILEHVRRLVDDEIVWAPAIEGAVIVSMRGGDFALHLGQDMSIGYTSHTDTSVQLYLQESFTFMFFTSEAVVVLGAPTT